MLERQEFHTALEHRTLKLVRTLVSGQVVLNTGEEHKPDHEGEQTNGREANTSRCFSWTTSTPRRSVN
jgi:hypothetical protein